MDMQYVKCENCQCWSPDAFELKDDPKDDPNYTRRGICARHAPASLAVMPNIHVYYVRIFGRWFKTGITRYNISNTGIRCTMRRDQGCWEGVPRNG